MYQVGIIGLGSIAEGYGAPDNRCSYCHAGGILFSSKVKLAAVADLSAERRGKFQRKWGAAFPDLRYYESSAAMFVDRPLDIVAVCVRGPAHFAVMRETLAAQPHAVFLEKPATCSLEEMDLLAADARARRIPITVSYSRHWAPHLLRLQELVAGGLIGEVRKIVGFCGGDLLSFASHTTDLLGQFAGSRPVAVFAQGTVPAREGVPAGYEPEPVLEAMVIAFANGVTGIQVGHAGEFGSFYCDVLGTKGWIRAGIYTPPHVCGEDGNAIDLTRLAMPENRSVFTVAYDQIAAHLDGGPLPHCTDQAFHDVHETGFAAIESMRTGAQVKLPVTNRSRKIFANG